MTLSASSAKEMPAALERSKTLSIKELQATMEAAQEQLRPFCMSETPASFPGCSLLYVLHVCFRPLLERFAPNSWKGFYVELARLGGPSGVLTLLTIARIDADGTGDIDEAELNEFDSVARKLILDTCDALQTSAVTSSLLFGACFQAVIGRPTPLVASDPTVERFGEDMADMLHWVAYSTMSLISVLCLIVVMYAFGSRMELQNVLPSTQARLFYLCEVNPMNAVTAMSTISMLLFVVVIIFGGLLASPRQGCTTVLALPLFFLLANPLWQGMRNGPIRLRLEARAFLGISNSRVDFAALHKKAKGPAHKSCRLKNYLAVAHSGGTTIRGMGGNSPVIVGVVQQALKTARVVEQQRQEAALAMQGNGHANGPSMAAGFSAVDAPQVVDASVVAS